MKTSSMKRVKLCGTVHAKQLGAVAWYAKLHNVSLRGFAVETAYRFERAKPI